MATSQNGYPVIASSAGTRLWQVPQTDRALRLRPGDPGFVLIWLALWFHQRIEDLDRERTWDDWGWAYRKIAGSNTYSNHASGTAVDLNAVQHPQGVHNTFTPIQRTKINWCLRVRLRGVVRWGGTFSTTVDDMHWEINKPMEDVRRVAERLRSTPRGKEIRRENA
jgi:hypothetical protein